MVGGAAQGRETETEGGEVMKQIMKWNNDLDRWEPLSASYSGLTDEEAKKELKQLRRWAREENTGAKYKTRNIVMVPV